MFCCRFFAKPILNQPIMTMDRKVVMSGTSVVGIVAILVVLIAANTLSVSMQHFTPEAMNLDAKAISVSQPIQTERTGRREATNTEASLMEMNDLAADKSGYVRALHSSLNTTMSNKDTASSVSSTLLSSPTTSSTKTTTTTTATANVSALPIEFSTTKGCIEIGDAGDNPMQVLVLAPQRGIVVALGTTDLHPCPLPDYKDHHLRLSNGNTTFRTIQVQHHRGTSGPMVVAFFDIGISEWERLKAQDTAPSGNNIDAGNDTDTDSMVLFNDHTKKQQKLKVLVDPAWRNGRNKDHFLSATTTVRKHYQYYQGMGKSSNHTQPSTWDLATTVKNLNRWIHYHRALGVSHFYLIDNYHGEESDDLLSLLIKNIGNSTVVTISDITYIRARHIHYDIYNCKRQDYTVSGQSILENSIIRFARTKWLLVSDLDEFVVVGDKHNESLVELVQHFEGNVCRGSDPNGMINVSCHPLDRATEDVFAIQLSPFLMNQNGQTTTEYVFQRKSIVQTALTKRVDVHYPFGFTKKEIDTLSTTNTTRPIQTMTTSVPPRQAWIAHFNRNKLRNQQHFNLDLLVPNLRKTTKGLRSTRHR